MDHKHRVMVRSADSSHNQKEMVIEYERVNEQNVKDDRHFAPPSEPITASTAPFCCNVFVGGGQNNRNTRQCIAFQHHQY